MSEKTNMPKYADFITRLLLLIVVVLNLSNPCFSQTIVKALPGFPGELPFKLETGYVENPANDPLLIWISGGPGCSTLRSFFYQIGPLTIEYPDTSKEIPDLHLNPYSWTKLANVIFLDTPTSGFSYAKSPETFRDSDTLLAKYTYQFLSKWLEKHSKFISNPLYITGLSYSGITIPLIVQEIFNGNEAENEPRMNIAGYIIGNP
ncbi:Serine carboxypeptidase-like 7 [Heracleum sosnowskyi]|uniref:Serine carboxypeptidase-like 7 n=1 Tax=Heracleum sosnowskyi TaxID=360622 RepID=A0AAD8H3N6_9APIA|nr:Serine carboxypeptidase-like 7 [Heracleum sosnowskyi]